MSQDAGAAPYLPDMTPNPDEVLRRYRVAQVRSPNNAYIDTLEGILQSPGWMLNEEDDDEGGLVIFPVSITRRELDALPEFEGF